QLKVLSTFSKAVGSRGKAPCGIFKGEALKLIEKLKSMTYFIYRYLLSYFYNHMMKSAKTKL
ncbi:MAG: hypothetical protein IJU14_05260, partial [Clostridia bacterium]|nr:hypothetical protein [Clostridia bacterium]